MKKTAYIKQIRKDNRYYNLKKREAYLHMILSFGETRKQRKISYTIYQNDYRFDDYNNDLPSQYYFKPTDIIIYDLIRKEDLQKTKKGLIKLIHNCYSHRFIGIEKSEEDIDSLIKGLDQTLNSGESWYRTSVFDFAYNIDLSSYIDHFEICFRNFSSSYSAIEMKIMLSEKFIDELSQFIKKPYKKPGMCIHRVWGRNNRKSGAKITYGVGPGTTSEYAKSQIIYEQLQYVKSIFLSEMVKYFPLLQSSINRSGVSINVFETNITPSSNLGRSVYIGLGLNELFGFYISNAERLYASTGTATIRYEPNSDVMFVYNPDCIDDYRMYVNAHNKVLKNLTFDYMSELYVAIVLRNIGSKYHYLISNYRNIINECKTNKMQYKKLLKIQYRLNQDFYDFQKIDDELPVMNKLKDIEEYLLNNTYAKTSVYYGMHTCEQFIAYPRWIWEQIKKNYIEVTDDLNHKIEISNSLAKYSIEKKNRFMVFAQVVLAALTFFFLIFPRRAEIFADQIKTIWNIIVSIFHK